VLMIVIVTTIDVYLAVYKGTQLEQALEKEKDQDRKPGWLTRWKALQAARAAAP
jgi:hypothetical protein